MQDTKVVLCTPTITKPHMAWAGAIQASIEPLKKAGIDAKVVIETGNPYISGARATMLRKALDGGADIVVFIDHDMSWEPSDLIALIETEGDVVAGVYRFKKPEVEYMGAWEVDDTGRPLLRDDGCIKGARVPAGFLKVTRQAVERFMRAYPELCYGSPINPAVDMFNHGAFEGVWWGEDYAFSRRWIACGGDIWIIPDINLDHHGADEVFPGNLHEFLMAQPGGSKAV